MILKLKLQDVQRSHWFEKYVILYDSKTFLRA